ncbi:MAG: ATP-binding protein [Lachnospiraceae bacterium]|nr:ATP-binding protein [Robinsoniella sp.]MDY3767556.1 ATP-binding protein [Lachnospiraceae bacterium]
MPLKNSQYDAILRTYQRDQFDNKHRQDECVQKAYQSIPELSQIDRQISSLCVNRARKLLSGDENALDDLKAQIASLSSKRTQALADHGFPADYLELHYTCPDCKDTGYIGTEKCHCFRQKEIDLLYMQSNIREILEVENFSNFSYQYYSPKIINPDTGLSALETAKAVIRQCNLFLRSFDTAHGNLFFYGNTGVGKTFLSHCIAKWLIDHLHSVIYFSAFQLFDLFAKYTFSRAEEVMDFYPHIFECDLLIIDDLGTELTNSFVSSQLFLCINERLTRKKSTIISTNLPMERFSETYSERVFSRITSNYTMCKLIGDDIRIQKKLERTKNLKPRKT